MNPGEVYVSKIDPNDFIKLVKYFGNDEWDIMWVERKEELSGRQPLSGSYIYKHYILCEDKEAIEIVNKYGRDGWGLD